MLGLSETLQLHNSRWTGPRPGGEISPLLCQDTGLREGEGRPLLHQGQETQDGAHPRQVSQKLTSSTSLLSVSFNNIINKSPPLSITFYLLQTQLD